MPPAHSQTHDSELGDGELESLRVWVASCPEQVPTCARFVRGTLVAHCWGGSCVRVDLDGGKLSVLRLSDVFVTGFSFFPKENDGYTWHALANTDPLGSSRQDGGSSVVTDEVDTATVLQIRERPWMIGVLERRVVLSCLKVTVRTHCCREALENVELEVNGQKFSTDASGRASALVPQGVVIVKVRHAASPVSEQLVEVSSGVENELNVALELGFFGYCITLDANSTQEANGSEVDRSQPCFRQVWMCADPSQVPASANVFHVSLQCVVSANITGSKERWAKESSTKLAQLGRRLRQPSGVTMVKSALDKTSEASQNVVDKEVDLSCHPSAELVGRVSAVGVRVPAVTVVSCFGLVGEERSFDAIASASVGSTIGYGSLRLKCCPLRWLHVEPVPEEHYSWQPASRFPLGGPAEGRFDCCHLHMLRRPILVGAMVPIVRILQPDGQILEFSVTEFRTAASLVRCLALELGCDEGLLSLRSGNTLLEGDSVLSAFHGGPALSMRCQSCVCFHAATRCCNTSIQGLRLHLGDRTFCTDMNGEVSVWTCLGETLLRAELGGHSVFESTYLSVFVAPLTKVRVDIRPVVCLHVHAVATVHGNREGRHVWLSADRDKAPARAEQISGTLTVTQARGTIYVDIDHSNYSDGVRVPVETSDAQAACMLHFEFSPNQCDEFTWSPVNGQLFGHTNECAYLRLLESPAYLGCLSQKTNVRGSRGSVVDIAQTQTALREVAAPAKKEGKLASLQTNGHAMSRESNVGQLRQAPESAVQAVGYLKVCVETRCCGHGVRGACVNVVGKSFLTDSDGDTETMVVPQGDHAVRAQLSGMLSPEYCVFVGSQEGALLHMPMDVSVFAYSTTRRRFSSRTSPIETETVVWLCADNSLVPQDAEPVQGSVFVTRADGTRTVAQLVGDTRIQAVELLTLEDATVDMSRLCALHRVSVEAVVADGCLWVPRDPEDQADLATRCSCLFLHMLFHPVRMGTIELVVSVCFPEGFETVSGDGAVKLALNDFPTIAKVRLHLAQVCRIPEPLIFFTLKSTGCHDIADEEGSFSGLDVKTVLREHSFCLGGLVANVFGILQVEAFTACCGSRLAGVRVTVAGHEYETDSSGSAVIVVRPGLHVVRSRHVDSQFAEHTVHVKPQEQMSPGKTVLDKPSDLQVWVCSDRRLVRDDAVPLAGLMSALGSGAKRISTEICAGAKVEATTLDSRSLSFYKPCALSSVTISPSLNDNFVYHPILPSPVEDLASKQGGCEYIELLQQPLQMGSMVAVVNAHGSSGRVVNVPVLEYPTVADALRYVSIMLGVQEDHISFEIDGTILGETFPLNEVYGVSSLKLIMRDELRELATSECRDIAENDV
eukprot:TRINITY_DN6749_c0_g1_i2.p1 TRINITY_DN6749_c0_g1~~TRINITY_DN6749_c0_g1_i2.p1  ORF type:complete len:1575 (+),score=256.74 TRINITY_DN6749_c0_g1_i2:665-4726(+)